MAGNNVGIILQKRDGHLLRELAVLRVIDREQAKVVAGFGSTTRANTRLLALARSGLLRRFFLGTAASGRKALYSLSKRGAQLVEVPYRGPRLGTNQTVVVDFFVTHQLRINEILCTVKYRAIPTPGVQFVQWKSFHESIDVASPLIPDGYVELRTPPKTLTAFLEVDLGNESRPVWRAKMQSYLRYAISGHFERQFGHAQFRTLVVASSERRLSSLRAATAELTEKIFWFTTFESITKLGFWAPIWQRPKDHQLQSLIGNPL
jgi:Replication-relaxation